MKKQQIERAILDCVFTVEKKSVEVKTINQKKVAEIFGKDNIKVEETKRSTIHHIHVAGRHVAKVVTRHGFLIRVEVLASVPARLVPLTGKQIQIS